jgi:uncharacterized protein YeeX (DUF496 family)
MQINIHNHWPEALQKHAKGINEKLGDAKSRKAELETERQNIKHRILSGAGLESDSVRLHEIRLEVQGLDAVELAGLIERQNLEKPVLTADTDEYRIRDADLKKEEEKVRKRYKGLSERLLRDAVMSDESCREKRMVLRPNSADQFRVAPGGTDPVSLRIAELTGLFQRL